MLVQVIAHARRRLWWNALLLQLIVAATVGLFVLVLMLLLGTDVIAGRWPVILPLTCLAAGTWMAWRRLPALSPTAELLDRRLRLPDTLATALFFSRPHPDRSSGEEFCRALHAQASRIVAGLSLREVVPVKMPRTVLFPALLAIAAASLFMVRYQSAARLDLKEPMGLMLRQLMEGARVEVAKLVEELKPAEILERMKSEEGKKSAPAPDGENAEGKPPGSGDSNSAERGAAASEQEKPRPDTFAGEREPREGEPKQGDQMAADSQSGAPRNGSENQGKDGPQQQQQQQQAAGNQAASSNGGSGMVNKVKDTLANLLSALKPQQGAAGQQAMNGQEQRTSGSGQKKGAADAGSASGEKGEGDSSKPGTAMAGGAGQTGQSQSEKLQGTGAGSNEGSKEIRSAEQLEAIGKLDRVFGKRAENVTGEMTVQAPPGPQNLSTPYAQRTAEHSSVETTAMRDEVPVAFQDYVQHYYDLLRREEASTRRQGRVMASARKSRSVR